MRAKPSSGRAAIGRSLMTIGLGVLGVLGTSGCHLKMGSPGTDPGGNLRAGIAPDFPPLCFRENGQVSGIEADFAQKLGERGMKVTLTPMSWDELIPALQDGRIDVIMSGMSITDQRIKLVDFAVPYLRVGQMALVRRADYSKLRRDEAMDQPSARVGFIANTTGEKYARSHLLNAKLIPVQSVDEGLAALRGNKIDFYINDAPIIWRLTSHHANPDLAGLYRPLTSEYVAWAVRQGADGDALRQQLNGALLTWQENGQLESVLDRWITVRKVTLETR
jgi:polar amino acid transport system substrate-binding protein